MSDTRYLPVFAVMLVVAVVVSTLTARLRSETEASRRREWRTAALLELTKELVPLQEPGALETFARQTGTALERARLAAESRRAEHLAELSHLKSRFVAVAAHELRNPLGSLGLVREPTDQGEQP